MSSHTTYSAAQRIISEALGSGFLLTAIVGSGLMAEKLSAGSVGLALLCNSLATGAVLVVLISMLAPISGAHFNPAVTLVQHLDGHLHWRDLPAYVLAQTGGAILGVFAAHAMFDQPLMQLSDTARSGAGQYFAEGVATFGLVLIILMVARVRPDLVAICVGLYITSAYWFTASTSFANPAVTVARTLTDTFTGIRPTDAAVFLAAQLFGALIALLVARGLRPLSHAP